MIRRSRRAFLRHALAGGLVVAGAAGPLQALAAGAGASPAHNPPFRIHLVLPGVEGKQEEAFRYYLMEHGVKAEFTVDSTGDDPGRLPAIVARLKADPPDLIYTTGTPTTLGIAGRYDDPDDGRFIRDVPIVFTTVADPVAAGILPSLDSGARNITGSGHLAPLQHQLSTILSYRPVRTIGVLYNPAEPNAVLTVQQLEPLANAQGIRLLKSAVPLDASGRPRPETVSGLIADLARKGAELLYIGPDTFVASRAGPAVTQAALDNRLPSFSAVEATMRLQPGALLGLVSSETDQGLAAGYKAEQILVQGRHPATLPSHPLARHSLLVNVPVASALDSYPPMEIITLADFVTR